MLEPSDDVGGTSAWSFFGAFSMKTMLTRNLKTSTNPCTCHLEKIQVANS